jgi:hypothetical protein
MKVYLAHSGDINKHGHQVYDLIGVFKDKDMAIKAIKNALEDVNILDYAVKDGKQNGNMFWIEHAMDVDWTVGKLEVRELL